MIERIDYDKCDQCGYCLEVCPSDVFRREPGSGRFYIAYLDDCQTCFNCELECPEGAIRVGPFRQERPQAWQCDQRPPARSRESSAAVVKHSCDGGEEFTTKDTKISHEEREE